MALVFLDRIDKVEGPVPPWYGPSLVYDPQPGLQITLFPSGVVGGQSFLEEWFGAIGDVLHDIIDYSIAAPPRVWAAHESFLNIDAVDWSLWYVGDLIEEYIGPWAYRNVPTFLGWVVGAIVWIYAGWYVWAIVTATVLTLDILADISEEQRSEGDTGIMDPEAAAFFDLFGEGYALGTLFGFGQSVGGVVRDAGSWLLDILLGGIIAGSG